jgi:hypothetical protein
MFTNCDIFSGKINEIEDSKNMVLQRLFKNNFTYKKLDSLMKRISNMSSWLLKTPGIKKAVMLKSLKKEMDEIPETNKNQWGVLQDLLLVKGICCLTQLDYFRHESQLKIADLKNSQTFATQRCHGVFSAM